jgi:glycosyltransferase involved in cell wall biosynthesis
MESKRVRILFLIPTLTGGGSERVIITLLRHLDRNVFQLSLAVVDTKNAAFQNDIPDDVEFIDLKCSRVRYALPKIIKHIWQKKPDIVFSTLGHLNLAISIFRSLLPNKVCYIARESSIVSKTINCYRHRELWKWLYRNYYGRFDKVVCQSKHMQSDLVSNHSLPIEKTVIVRNPVDINQIRIMATEKVIPIMEKLESASINFIAAGRLVPVKGFDILIEAIALCRNPHINLTILGEGPMQKKLELLVEGRKLKNQVRFVGFQKNPYPYFLKADAYILSSLYEGFPNVILEALACNTPVISMPGLGEVSDIVGSIHGCMVADTPNSIGLSNAINRWIESEKDDFDASYVISSFSVEKIVRAYELVLSSVLTDKL